jgi:multidrug efflux pump subunit AcrB
MKKRARSDASPARGLVATLWALSLFGFFILSRSPGTLDVSSTLPTFTVELRAPGVTADTLVASVTPSLEQALRQEKGVIAIDSETADENVRLTVRVHRLSPVAEFQSRITVLVESLLSAWGRTVDAVQVISPSTSLAVDLLVVFTNTTPASSLFAEEILRKNLQALPGVASVQAVGEEETETVLVLDAKRMSGLGLSVDDVVQSLSARRGKPADVSSARLKKRFARKSLTPSTLSNWPVRLPDGTNLALGEIADIAEGRTVLPQELTWNGHRALLFRVRHDAQTSGREAARRVLAQVQWSKANGQMPPGVEVMALSGVAEQSRATVRRVAVTVSVSLLILFLMSGGLQKNFAHAWTVTGVATFVGVAVLIGFDLATGSVSVLAVFGGMAGIFLASVLFVARATGRSVRSAGPFARMSLAALTVAAVGFFALAGFGATAELNFEAGVAFVCGATATAGFFALLGTAALPRWRQGAAGFRVRLGEKYTPTDRPRGWQVVAAAFFLIGVGATVFFLTRPFNLAWFAPASPGPLTVTFESIPGAAASSAGEVLRVFSRQLKVEFPSVDFFTRLERQTTRERGTVEVYFPKDFRARDELERAVMKHLARWRSQGFETSLSNAATRHAWQVRLDGPDATALLQLGASWRSSLVQAGIGEAGFFYELVSRPKLEFDPDRAQALGVTTLSAERALSAATHGIVLAGFEQDARANTLRVFLSKPELADFPAKVLVRGESEDRALVYLRDVATVQWAQAPRVFTRRNGLDTVQIKVNREPTVPGPAWRQTPDAFPLPDGYRATVEDGAAWQMRHALAAVFGLAATCAIFVWLSGATGISMRALLVTGLSLGLPVAVAAGAGFIDPAMGWAVATAASMVAFQVARWLGLRGRGAFARAPFGELWALLLFALLLAFGFSPTGVPAALAAWLMGAAVLLSSILMPVFLLPRKAA